MKQNDLTGWLLDNGGPVVRYLVATELAPGAHDTVRLTTDLLKDGEVQQWMNCLMGLTGFNDIHGSKDTCLENALGKLALFGIRKGMGDLDRKCKLYLVWLQENRTEDERNVIGVFTRTVVASMLALSGYGSERIIREAVFERLDFIHDFVGKGDYSIYAEKTGFRGIPQAFRHYPLVHPDLYPNGNFALPWIYDVFAFRALYVCTKDKSQRRKIEKVMSYIMHPAYQKLHDGYGIVCTGKNRYHVMGWNVWLPAFDGMHVDDFKMGCLVQRLELMSHFPNVLSSSWFMNNLNRLEEYSTNCGTYRFPKHYIQEKKNSYFVTGGHMGLGENRRRKSAFEIESTLWAMKIARNMTATT
ncbi:hypothetical protein KAS45_02885 [candidate division WOR-3 bacterium]|nr:hypothetical protein [candidate division WOR-3 bacterium]